MEWQIPRDLSGRAYVYDVSSLYVGHTALTHGGGFTVKSKSRI